MKTVRIFFMMLALYMIPTLSFAQNELQDFIDQLGKVKTRATSTQTVMDLSKFSDESKILSQPLYVRNGTNVKIINGTLSAASSYDGTMIRVEGNSKLELGDECVIDRSIYVHSGKPVVEVDGGEIIVNGGYVSTKKTPILAFSKTIRKSMQALPQVDSCIVINKSSDIFKMEKGFIGGPCACRGTFSMSDGEINGVLAYYNNAALSVKKGTVNINCRHSSADLYMEGIADVSFQGSGMVYIGSKLENDLSITKGAVTYGETCVAKGSGYQMTQSDVEHILLWVSQIYHPETGKSTIISDGHMPCPVSLSGNNVIAGTKATDVAEDEDDLQKRINASPDKTSYKDKPDTIKINPNGITITKLIRVPEKKKIVLTGGKFIIKDFGAHNVFEVIGQLEYTKTEIDLSAFNRQTSISWLFYVSGNLTIGEEMKFSGITSDNTLGFSLGKGYITYKAGTFNPGKVRSGDKLINGKPVLNMQGGCLGSLTEGCDLDLAALFMNGGQLDCHTITSIGGDNGLYGGLLRGCGETIFSYDGPCNVRDIEIIATNPNATYIESLPDNYGFGSTLFEKDGTYKFSGGSRIVGNVSIGGKWVEGSPIVYLNFGNKITMGDILPTKLQIDGNWGDFDFTNDVEVLNTSKKPTTEASGIKLAAAYQKVVSFLNLPRSVKPIYKTDGCIYLHKEPDLLDCLQCWLDGLGGDGGTEDNPIPLPTPNEPGSAITLDDCEESEPANPLQMFLDGALTDGNNLAWNFDCGYFTIPEESSIKIDNVDFYSRCTCSHFRGRGKIIVGPNVRTYGTTRVFHIYRGGHIYWRSKHDASGSTEVIYNEGGNVTIDWGTFSGGITNGGNIYFGGDSFSGHIYHIKGGCIYLTSLIKNITRTININIHITAEDIEIGKPIISGFGGFTLTDDIVKTIMKYITIYLPSGYEWYFKNGCIYIRSCTDAIDAVNTDVEAASKYYDLSGKEDAASGNGVRIIRSKDAVKKVIK